MVKTCLAERMHEWKRQVGVSAIPNEEAKNEVPNSKEIHWVHGLRKVLRGRPKELRRKESGRR